MVWTSVLQPNVDNGSQPLSQGRGEAVLPALMECCTHEVCGRERWSVIIWMIVV